MTRELEGMYAGVIREWMVGVVCRCDVRGGVDGGSSMQV